MVFYQTRASCLARHGLLRLNGLSRSSWRVAGGRAELQTCLPIQGRVELVDRRRDLEPGLENGLLPLEADVLGPLDEMAKVPLGLDVLANAEVAGTLLEQGVDNPLGIRLLHGQRSGCHLLALLVLSLWSRMFAYFEF